MQQGVSRNVLLTKRFAIKFPRLSSWRRFVAGLVSNLQEREFWKKKYPELCPVLLSDPVGLFVVMPRLKLVEVSLPYREYMDLVLHKEYCIPVENKIGSFGMYKDKIVAIDYGAVVFLTEPAAKLQEDWFEAQCQ